MYDKKNQNSAIAIDNLQQLMSSLPSTVGKSTDIIMRSIWLSVDEPGNKGLPSSISPSIQPKLHMSTPLVYLHQTHDA